jgi:TolA-binding protein
MQWYVNCCKEVKNENIRYINWYVSQMIKKTISLTLVSILVTLLVQAESFSARRSNSAFNIQIGSYQDVEKADNCIQNIKQSGQNAYAEKIVVKNKGLYRVNIGPFKNRRDAERVGKNLKVKGIIDGFSVQGSGNPAESTEKAKKNPVPASNIASNSRIKKEGNENKTKLVKVNADIALPKNLSSNPPIIDKLPPVTQSQSEKQIVPLANQSIPNGSESFPKGSFLEKAMSEFSTGQYKNALDKLLEANRANLDPVIKEKVLRRIADCYFYIGMKGSNRDLLSAVDTYKEVLQKYPSAEVGNDEALYRLAKSYVQLKFYYEAKREFKNLSSRYRNSRYFSEALFMSAEMSYKTRNFEDAALRFREYIDLYPQGIYSKRAHFGLGESYAQIQQNDKADSWYSEALRKWPLEEIPKESLLQLGYHYFYNRKYQEAVRVFFHFVNIYPEDEVSRDVLFSIARSFVAIEQNAIALKVFSLLIERFPDSREAQESAIIMANIGVKTPALKVPDLPGIQNYRDPLKVYNNMLAQSGMGDMTEGLLFQKGYALWKYGRYEESFGTFSKMVHLFPEGRYKAEGIRSLILDMNQLVRQYGSRGDDLAIVKIYYKVPEGVLNKYGETEVVSQIGDALKRLGFFSDSKKIFEALLKSVPVGSEHNRILLSLADVEKGWGRYNDAENILQQIPDNARSDRKIQSGIQRLRADIFLQRGLYEKAVAAYADVISSGMEIDDAVGFYRNYASALKEMNAYSAAIANYQKVVAICIQAEKENRTYPKEILIRAQLGIGECYAKEGKYQEAIAIFQNIKKVPDGSVGLWALYDMGKSYAKMNKPTLADKTFSDLKNRGGDEFWPTIIDYYNRENAWTGKYAKYVR